jgi:hypothetical protein
MVKGGGGDKFLVESVTALSLATTSCIIQYSKGVKKIIFPNMYVIYEYLEDAECYVDFKNINLP